MSNNKKPMSKEDASRIQSGVDKGNTKKADEGFKQRAQKSADKNEKKESK
ncbi:MAG: hypothetical protein KDK36_01555 [Leptospiraceae bacterium]|nr:hypothetical protein [Leptospiraceae bacterium]